MRNEFLLDPHLTFLNHGSFGACPREVFEVYQGWQRELENNPVEFLSRRSGSLLAQAREALGAFLNASAGDLAFVPNSTTGVNLVAQSLKLQPGDEVLTVDHEYGACLAAWRIACERQGAHLRVVDIALPFARERFAEQVLASITPRTRLLFLSHITSATALRFPVEDLIEPARQRGVLTMIDGAHAPGQIALDLSALDADFYVGNLHKWLCAPKGAAFIHIRPEHHRSIEASVVSWGYVAGADGALADSPRTPLDAFTGRAALERRLQWQGTRDLSAFLSVPAAIDFQARHDWPQQRQRCHALALTTLHRVLARSRLASIADDEDFVQMVPIPVRTDDGAALQRLLFEHDRIEVPVTQHGPHSFVRVSVQAYNTQADLDALCEALARRGV